MDADKQLKSIIIVFLLLVSLILITGVWGIYYINKMTEISWNDCLTITENEDVMVMYHQ